LDRDKFEVCCVPTEKSHHACWRDAKEDVVAELKDGTAYYLPVCDDPQHLALAKEAQRKLAKGVSLDNLSQYVVKLQVFIKPVELQDKKCKITQWENFQKRKLTLPVEDVLAKPIKKNKVEIQVPERKINVVHTAVPRWEWVDDIGRWMDIKGNRVALSHLSDKEIRHTALAIRDANFQKISKNVAWTKEIHIEGDHEGFVFPEDALKVGARVAIEKLEDFRIECKRRGYI
jgi:hypothetical protein